MNEILKDREIENGAIVPIKLEFDKENKPILVTRDYIDISYKSIDTSARILSNLYPYKFEYFGKMASSVEAILQSLKYEDDVVRHACYDYFGIDSWHLRGMKPFEWQKDGILYTDRGPIDRFSEDYQIFLDDLYYLVFQNPLYQNNLLTSGTKKLDHTNGENDSNLTILTRTEYISRLYALRYCVQNELFLEDEVSDVLKVVREELKLKRVF